VEVCYQGKPRKKRTKNKRTFAPNFKEKKVKSTCSDILIFLLLSYIFLFHTGTMQDIIRQVPFEIDNLVKVAFRLFSVCNGGSLLTFDFFSALLTAYGSTFCNSSYTKLKT
jgi:hypothetical protein